MKTTVMKKSPEGATRRKRIRQTDEWKKMKIQEILRMKRTGIEKILQIDEIPYPEIMHMNPLPEIRNMKILLEMTRMKIHQIDEMMRLEVFGILEIVEIVAKMRTKINCQ